MHLRMLTGCVNKVSKRDRSQEENEMHKENHNRKLPTKE